MGYTHYWTVKDPDKVKAVLPRIVADARIIIRNAVTPVANWEGKEGTKPTLGPKVGISLNGVGDDAYESFIFPPKPSPYRDKLRGFTKTAREPYDLVVTAILRRVEHHAGDAVEIESDGIMKPDVYPANYIPGALTMDEVRKRYEHDWLPADRLVSHLFPED